jgi:hypothetical protein
VARFRLRARPIGTQPVIATLEAKRKDIAMKKIALPGAVAFAMATTALNAAPLYTAGHGLGFDAAPSEQIWLAKNDKGNGNGNGNAKWLRKGQGNSGNGNPGKGNGQANNGNGNGSGKPGKGNDVAGNGNENGNAKPVQAGGAKVAVKANGNGNGKGRPVYTTAERDEVVKRLVSTPAPANRDMLTVLGVAGATALALASPDLVVADVPEDELITYANCPPGLAKKNPPCVPPGLAKKGVTFEEWASYDRDQYDELWLERRAEWLDREREIDPDPELLLLQSDQIATLFGLDPAPEGRRYALIDGLPVLLDEEDYTSLMLVNQMAQVADLAGIPIAPTAALTQNELINLYRLPQLGADQNYAVVNGQIVQLDDSEYEILQMIRVARAVL